PQGSEPSKAPAGEKRERPAPSGSGRSGDSPAPPSTLGQTASPVPISLVRPGQGVAASGQAASHPSRPAEGEKEAKPQAKGQAPASPDSVVSPSPGHAAVAAQGPVLPRSLEPAQAVPSQVAPAPVEARDILGQVIGRVKVSVSGERTEARIHLVPEQLGPVDLKVSMEGGQLTARFHVATGQVKEILEQHLLELKQALHDQGFRVEQFSVTMGAGTTAQDAGNGHQAAAWQNQAGQYGRYGRYREEPAAVLATMEEVWSAGARAGGLDLMA
ncbi:MAG: flagellar hook-length control protein FliK, partial [Firmicutes bacterium]|nr:flagellar hook-length control protein FliK [Bacillota bacterium]